MEVAAQDRPGLLHQVSRALQACKVNLVAAKVATYGERAEDVFFLTTRTGGVITDPAQRECLVREVYGRLSRNPNDDVAPPTQRLA